MAKFCSPPQHFSISKTATDSEVDLAGGLTGEQNELLAALHAYEDALEEIVDELRDRFEALDCPRGCHKQWGTYDEIPELFPYGRHWSPGEPMDKPRLTNLQRTSEPGVGITHRVTLTLTAGPFYVGCVNEPPDMDPPDADNWLQMRKIRWLQRIVPDMQ